MKKFTALILSCVAVLVIAASAVAGERGGAFSISPFVGGYTFDGVQHLNTAPVFGLRLGIDMTKHVGLEAVGNYLQTDGTRSERTINSISYRLDLLYNFMPDGPVVPYVAVGGGGVTSGHGPDGLEIEKNTTNATVNAGFGLKYFMTDSIALRGDARQLFVLQSPNSPLYNWEYSVGLTFLLGGKTAAAAAVPPAAEIPSARLTADPSSVNKGQSATLTWSAQNVTACEIQPEIGTVQPQGSITVTPVKSTTYTLSCSGDNGTSRSEANLAVIAPVPPAPPAPTANLTVEPSSITKGQSATLTWSSQNATTCEIQPEIGAVQPQGTMAVTPADNATYTLSCSGEGGTVVKSVANLSVAAAPQAPPQKLCCHMVADIRFDTNKYDIKPKYYGEVQKMGDFLTKYPNSNGIIEGHTDNVGSKAHNLELSQRRADSVRDYLIAKFGIAPERLKAIGFGLTKPIANNKTAAGRAKNRRIEANFFCN